jgi:Mrp family chromosome partitioning ATPase
MLDQLRSAMLRATSAKGWRRIGISAPRRGAGSSFVAVGLAAAVARLDYLRTVLVDLDLGQPTLHRHLGLTAPGPLEPVLRGEVPALAQAGRVGANLALLPNAAPVEAPADLLHSPEAILALRGVIDALAPDLTLLDLPPLLTDPAALAALAQVDAVLLVADGTRSTARDITECERRIEGQTPLLGIVLNKSEDRPAPARSR